MNNRYIWIDSLKGISILGVVLIHSGAMNLGGPISVVARYGSTFVQAFFVVSVFLVWKSLDGLHSDLTFTKYMRWFYHKVIKLVPAYYAAIVLYGLITGGNSYWAGDENPLSIKSIVLHLLFLHGLDPKCCNNILGVEWYVGVLVIFYLLAPFVHKVIDNLPKAVIAFILANMVCNYICGLATGAIIPDEYSNIYEEYYCNYGFFSQVPTLLSGVVLYYVLPYIKVNSDRYVKIIVSVLVMILAFAVLRYHMRIESVIPFLKVTTPTLYGIFFAVIIISQYIYAGPLLNNKIWSFFGTKTWEIYLFHFLIFHIFDKFFATLTNIAIIDWGVKYIASIILVIIVYTVVNKLIYIIKMLLNRYKI